MWTRIPAKLAAALAAVCLAEKLIKLSSFLRVTVHLVEKPKNLSFLKNSTSPISSPTSFSLVLEKNVKWEKTGKRKTEG